MKPTASGLIRWAGLAALAAGIIFAGIQPVHPPDELSSVTSRAWAIITLLKFVMCLLFLVGITGIYARQLQQSGWLGLLGYVAFCLSWAIQSGFVFVEAFVLPVLATAAPTFVESYLGVVNGHPAEMNIGHLPRIYSLLVGVPYTTGGLLFGIATFRACVLPRWPAGLLAAVALLTPLSALLPHAIQRLAAVPMGLAVAWLGYSLFSERRKDSRAVPSCNGSATAHAL
jgi:hypothetical protein